MRPHGSLCMQKQQSGATEFFCLVLSGGAQPYKQCIKNFTSFVMSSARPSQATSKGQGSAVSDLGLEKVAMKISTLIQLNIPAC